MKKLIQVVIGLQTIGGAVFFCALFVSALPASIKVLAAIALAFVSSAVFLLVVNQLAVAESLRTLAASPALNQSSLPGEVATVQAALTQINGGLRLQPSGKLGYMLLWMFAIWLFGGWVLSQYVA